MLNVNGKLRYGQAPGWGEIIATISAALAVCGFSGISTVAVGVTLSPKVYRVELVFNFLSVYIYMSLL